MTRRSDEAQRQKAARRGPGNLSRRALLAGPAAAGAAALLTAPCRDALRQASGAEAPYRFRYAKCNETFAGWPQEKIFRCVAACGYGGVEIAPFTIARDVRAIGAKQRDDLRSAAERTGIQIVGLHWLLAKTQGFHLTSPDPAVRRATSGYLGHLATFCHDLGGEVLVFGSPKQRDLLPGVRREDGMRFAAEVLQRVMPKLAALDVTLALEPLAPGATNFLTTAAEAAELAQRVDAPHCKLILDCKAMATETRPIPELIRRHASRLVHFHANDPNRRGPGMGDLDFAPIFQALRDIRYRGWISVEVFDYRPGAETLARESIRYMKAIEAKLPG